MHMGFEVMVPCAPRSGGTALRFILNPVRPQGRPHFIRPTLGWRAESLWDRAPRTLHAFWMDGPYRGGVCGCSYRGFPCRGGVYRQRQRRSALQPRVARPALPWEPVPRIYQPHRGCGPDLVCPPRRAESGRWGLPNREKRPAPANVKFVVQPLGFESPEEEFILPPGGVESDQPGGRMLRRIPRRGPEAKTAPCGRMFRNHKMWERGKKGLVGKPSLRQDHDCAQGSKSFALLNS